MNEISDVERVVGLIRAQAITPITRDRLRDAARTIKIRHPALCLRVMEQIGSWPSSEPELAALQFVWR